MKKFIGRYILGLPRNKDNSFNNTFAKVRAYEKNFDFWFRLVLFGAMAGAIFVLSIYKPEGFNTVPNDIKRDYIDSNYPDKFYDHVVMPTSTPTPTPKPKSIVKVAYAKEYTYEVHANKPYYQEIILALQDRYENWQDGAQLIDNESDFDPFVINPTSGACFLPQALPCAKMGCEAGDVDCQLDWQKEYITGRYGTVSKALELWNIRNIENNYKGGWY